MTFHNPVISLQGIDHGDPAVIKHCGKYYLYHTGVASVPVYESMDLIHWEKKKDALNASENPSHWAQIDLWAPEVFYENGIFYMYITGARQKAANQADDNQRRIGVAKSTHPLGPFTLAEKPLTNEWSIDAHPFQDEGGKMYMFYNVRNKFTRGPGGIIGTGNVVDEMVNPETLKGEPSLVVKPEYSWEGNKQGTFYWNEGPFVLKKYNRYYQMYSAGYFGDDTYGVYYATADTLEDSLGYHSPGWKKHKHGKPVLQTNHACEGPGHHTVIKAPDGYTDYAVYHGYEPDEHVQERRVRIGRVKWDREQLSLEAPAKSAMPQPPLADIDARKMTEAEEINHKLKNLTSSEFLFETTITLSEDVHILLTGNGYRLHISSQTKTWELSWKNNSRSGKFVKEIDPAADHIIRIIQQKNNLQCYLNQILFIKVDNIPAPGTVQVLSPMKISGTILTKLPTSI